MSSSINYSPTQGSLFEPKQQRYLALNYIVCNITKWSGKLHKTKCNINGIHP